MSDLFENPGKTLRGLVLKSKKDATAISISGMKVLLVNVHEDSDVGKVKAAFKIVAGRAKNVFPDLLKYAPPVQVHFDDQWIERGLEPGTWGYFDNRSDEIVLIPRAVEQDVRRLANIIAHEIAHFMFLKRYSDKDKKAWEDFISGTTEIDLSKVLKMFPSGVYSENERAIKEKDPVLYLQLHSIKDMMLQGKGGPLALKRHCAPPFTRDAIECLIKQVGKKVRVVERPVSEYGSSSPIEAFAEAVSLLVAYGPRTLQPEVIAMLGKFSPGVKAEESPVRGLNFIDHPGAGLDVLMTEMAALPSLVSLQKKGNKKEASKQELANAHRRALQCKTPEEARAKAKEAWELMEKRQIIQIFLDRQDELLGLKYKAPKPDFIDQKVVPWVSLTKEQREGAAKWLAMHKSMDQLRHMLERAKSLSKGSKDKDSETRVVVYKDAMDRKKQAHKEWRAAANARQHYFGR